MVFWLVYILGLHLLYQILPYRKYLKCLNHTDKQASKGVLGKSNNLPNATFNSGFDVKSLSLSLCVFKSAAAAGGELWEEGGCRRLEKTDEFQIIQIRHHV